MIKLRKTNTSALLTTLLIGSCLSFAYAGDPELPDNDKFKSIHMVIKTPTAPQKDESSASPSKAEAEAPKPQPVAVKDSQTPNQESQTAVLLKQQQEETDRIQAETLRLQEQATVALVEVEKQKQAAAVAQEELERQRQVTLAAQAAAEEQAKKTHEIQQNLAAAVGAPAAKTITGGRSDERIIHNVNKETERAVRGVSNLLSGKGWKSGRRKK